MDILTLVAVLAAAAAVVVAALALRGRPRVEDGPAAEAAARTEQAVARLAEALAAAERRRADEHGETAQALARLAGEGASGSRSLEALRSEVAGQLSRDREAADRRLERLTSQVTTQLTETTRALTEQLAAANTQVATQLDQIRRDNARQLDAMRRTVDEKLERTLNDRLSSSFKQINDQLESVHQGLGTMQALASNVGDLRRVLSNVKTRGILGEVQLGAILADILAPEQYECDVATVPGSRNRVEFAVRVPVEGGDSILLPIDAKFPGDLYGRLVDAQETGDRDAVRAAQRDLEARICQEAKDIASKYVSVPHTTNFALMFLPFEGLYAEVVSTPGLIERLQRDYAVNVAGPSTMAALLNSLQLSYQTFALQRQTDEVMRVLQAVKAELPKYRDALRVAKRRIDSAGEAVDKVITTRTNVMERTLRSVALPEGAAPASVHVEAGAVAVASSAAPGDTAGAETLDSIFED